MTAARPSRLPRRLAMALLLLTLVACDKSIDLNSGLSDAEANEVVAALRGDGVAAEKHATKDGVTVAVPEASLPRATAVLQARGLPRQRPMLLGEVFKKEGLISSPLEEKARYMYALSQEIEYTLSQIDGVIVARVHLVLPEKIAPGQPVLPSSAAVFIKYSHELEPDIIEPRVRQLVARSIPGLAGAKDKITVVMVEGHAEPAPLPPQADNGIPLPAALGALAALLALLGAGLWLALKKNLPLPGLAALRKRDQAS
jgi:type III secretion protein J